MKWLIDEPGRRSGEDRRAYWESIHGDSGYGNVLSVTDDPRLRARIVDELARAGARRILIPGCGSRTLLERSILESLDVESVVCTDYPGVVELASERLQDPRLEYVARDSAALGFDDEFDAVVVVNAVLSDSDRENRDIVLSCVAALRGAGRLVGLFPSILANLDLATLAGDQRLLSTVDVRRSTKTELEQEDEQIFYTPLRLRVVLREAGLQIERFEIVFLDAPELRSEDQSYRELVYDDPDLVTYEYYVVARKS